MYNNYIEGFDGRDWRELEEYEVRIDVSEAIKTKIPTEYLEAFTKCLQN